jgi:hypothetical protein
MSFLNIGRYDSDSASKTLSKKGAAIIDMNLSADIPLGENKKKNKNDFYRFLLSQNN